MLLLLLLVCFLFFFAGTEDILRTWYCTPTSHPAGEKRERERYKYGSFIHLGHCPSWRGAREREHDGVWERVRIFVYEGNRQACMLFLHSALAQTKDYSSSNYSCTQFRSYDTPVRTRNKWGLDTKHDLKQAGMGVDTWGFEIISNKAYLVSKCVKNGRHSKVERCRQVTITKFNMQRERDRVGWRRGRHGGVGGGGGGGGGGV